MGLRARPRERAGAARRDARAARALREFRFPGPRRHGARARRHDQPGARPQAEGGADAVVHAAAAGAGRADLPRAHRARLSVERAAPHRRPKACRRDRHGAAHAVRDRDRGGAGRSRADRPVRAWKLTHRTHGRRELFRSSHSGLMLAARITLAHFSVSAAISLPKSAGEPGKTSAPSSENCALSLASARPALVSLLRLSIIAESVFLGATTPYHVLASYPGTCSPMVGRSGSASKRCAEVRAKARNVPARTYSIPAGAGMNTACTCPPIKSAMAGPPPRYGT